MRALHPSWRNRIPVLVPDADDRIALAVIRSLGRAGYVVHTCSAKPRAVGFHSRFLSRAAVCPPYESDGFIPWLRRYCATHGIRCLIPIEQLMQAIRAAYAEFAPLLPLRGTAETVYRGLSKFGLFERLGYGTDNLPPFLLLRREDGVPAVRDIEALGAPFFVKADGCHARTVARHATFRVLDAKGAVRKVDELFGQYDRLVVQGYVRGTGVGAFLLRWDGRIIARLMHHRLHEIPGAGPSSYRATIWHPAVMADAEAKLAKMDWQGVAMMEYRRDAESGRFALIEMNGRFWGSLHLAIYAGVDFPRMLCDAFFGHLPEPVSGADARIRCRHPLLEAHYVLWRIQDPAIGWKDAISSVLEYIRLGLDPRVKSDLWFPGDRQMILWQIWQALGSRATR